MTTKHKVISFVLWGEKQIYTVGLLENISLAKRYYPDWLCYVYVHNRSVSPEVKEELKKHDNVKIILNNHENIRPRRDMLYRFHPADDPDVDCFISRDIDSRISPREVMAVQEWLQSGKTLHILRDHPQHYPKILGGMFGLRCNDKLTRAKSEPTWAEEIDLFYRYATEQTDDQIFLQNGIYPRFITDCVIHDEIKKYEDFSLPYPIPYERNGHFIGGYINPDGSTDFQTATVLQKYLQQNLPHRISPYTVTYEEALYKLAEKIECIYILSECLHEGKTGPVHRLLLDKFVPVETCLYNGSNLTDREIQQDCHTARLTGNPISLREISQCIIFRKIAQKNHQNIFAIIQQDISLPWITVHVIRIILDILHRIPSWDVISVQNFRECPQVIKPVVLSSEKLADFILINPKSGTKLEKLFSPVSKNLAETILESDLEVYVV